MSRDRMLLCATLAWLIVVSAWFVWALAEIHLQIERFQTEMQGELETLNEQMEAITAILEAVGERLGAVVRVAEAMQALGSPATQAERLAMAAAVLRASETYGVPVDWILAVGVVESHWRPDVRGVRGERGPLQVLPETFWYLGMNCGDVACEIEAGVRYLALVMKRSRGDTATALARYHVGHNAPRQVALRKGGAYLRRVLRHMAEVSV